MADTIPAQFSYTLQDELGTKGVALVNALVDPAATVTQLNGQWSAIGLLLDAITSGKIIGGHYRVLEGTIGKTAPSTGSRIEQSGTFNFSATGTSYKTPVLVPSLVDTAIGAGGRIDLANADVLAFFTALTTAVAGVLEWTSANRQALLALVDALLSFRKHRKQLQRSSFEVAP